MSRIQPDLSRFKQIVRGRVREELRKHLGRQELIGRQGKHVVSIPIPHLDLRSGGATAALAQIDHFESLPQGFEFVEGNTSIDLLGTEPLLRFQQIDSFSFVPIEERVRMAFRRDGTSPVTTT